MSKAEEREICLSCKFNTCRGADDCPALQVGTKKKSIKIALLRDLLLAGYDPAEVCFAVVDGTALV